MAFLQTARAFVVFDNSKVVHMRVRGTLARVMWCVGDYGSDKSSASLAGAM
jgi:hypothetical protein